MEDFQATTTTTATTTSWVPDGPSQSEEVSTSHDALAIKPRYRRMVNHPSQFYPLALVYHQYVSTNNMSKISHPSYPTPILQVTQPSPAPGVTQLPRLSFLASLEPAGWKSSPLVCWIPSSSVDGWNPDKRRLGRFSYYLNIYSFFFWSQVQEWIAKSDRLDPTKWLPEQVTFGYFTHPLVTGLYQNFRKSFRALVPTR